MLKKSYRLSVGFCQIRAQQAAEAAEAEERAERQQVMIETVYYPFQGLLTPQEAQRIRDERRRNHS
jgi:hypothetical protein